MRTKLKGDVAKALERPLTPSAASWTREWIDGQRGAGFSRMLNDKSLKASLAVAVAKGDLSGDALITMQGVKKEEQNVTQKTKKPWMKAPAQKPKTKGSAIVAKASGGKDASNHIRVKSPFERFSTKTVVGKDKHGQERIDPRDGKTPMQTASDLQKAKLAVWMKFTALRAGMAVNWSDHDGQMIEEMFAKDSFQRVTGKDDEEVLDGPRAKSLMLQRQFGLGRGLSGKALLDDSISGGVEITPIVFDEALITTPVLNGELLPYVEVRDIARGRRVEAGSMGNPSITWGTTEGASIMPFNTAQFVTSMDSTIFNGVFACEVGQDFLSDSGLDAASALVTQIGEKYMEALDDVIAGGDGVTQPLGMLNGTITNSVNSDNGLPGPHTVSDLEGLWGAVGKQFRKQQNNCRFIMTDTAYRYFRSIPVGPTDERRVMGMGDLAGTGVASGLAGYTLHGVPVSINNSLLLNSQILFAACRLYRLYRRLGFTFRWVEEGSYLALRNLRLLVVRGRFGGTFTNPGGLALMSDGQS